MHDEFLTALRENPNDNVSRLVYADWLQECDDPRAEFLRLEVRLATETLPDDARAAAMNRLAELGRRAEWGWLMAVNRVPFVRCALRKKSSGFPLYGKVELAVYATRALLIAHNSDLLQYLRLKITDPLGGVSEGPYGEFPVLPSVVLSRILPGPLTSITVNLLNPIPVHEIMMGAYTVEAVYDYDGVQSRAEPLRVEVTDDDRRQWKLGRFAR